MRLLVTGATGFLGSRAVALLRAGGHDVIAVARPGGASRAASRELDAESVDAGDPAIRRLLADREVVIHFAGVPDPARARADPARAIRENVGTTLNLLEGCTGTGAALIYPSTVRAAEDPPPDPYATSKRLGEELCALHPAPTVSVRLTSVFGPGQVASEGATGAIANFAARALAGEPIVIPGDPTRARDFIYVDDVVAALELIAREGRWDGPLVAARGEATPLIEAAELVREAAGSQSELRTPGGELPPGENVSYLALPSAPDLQLRSRTLRDAIRLYVDWLRRHPAAQGRS
jgi:UDP-glucose 4-epimerase